MSLLEMLAENGEVDIVELKKIINKTLLKARKSAKLDNCVLCGKKQTSFCNSHSVPQLSLKNIAEDGKLYSASFLTGIDIINAERGVKNAGTFYTICNECDSKFFQDYENESNLFLFPNDKMLAEIAVKNLLVQLSKRYIEVKLYPILQRKYNRFDNLDLDLDVLLKIHNLDIRDYKDEIYFHKDIA
ncbi:MAG: hypothetical protein LUH47_07335, partial [Clostridiales bacterium]|nr:hypothetical protein [Clostridiales bacterium]